MLRSFECYVLELIFIEYQTRRCMTIDIGVVLDYAPFTIGARHPVLYQE